METTNSRLCEKNSFGAPHLSVGLRSRQPSYIVRPWITKWIGNHHVGFLQILRVRGSTSRVLSMESDAKLVFASMYTGVDGDHHYSISTNYLRWGHTGVDGDTHNSIRYKLFEVGTHRSWWGHTLFNKYKLFEVGTHRTQELMGPHITQ